MQENPDSAAGEESKSSALQCIANVIDACPFPALANDWGLAEIKCCAVNSHYEENKQIPKEQLLGKNNRTLDPTHMTSLPGKVRLGIRAAMSYGFRYNQKFVSVKTAEPERQFMKSISMRTVCLGGHRFIIALQRTSGDHTALTRTFNGDRAYRGTMADWWVQIEDLVSGEATRTGLSVAWVQAEDAAKWEASFKSGIFEQTQFFCRKEQLDQALQKAMSDLSYPAILLDPFLPECPVIGLNQAAQELTGWKNMSSHVASADRVLEQVDYAGGAGGAYHINYGAYSMDEVEERLAVRASCCNGRPCLARFRRMYDYPPDSAAGEPQIFMKLQGVTLCQGVIAGPLSGGDVWYLVGILGKDDVSAQNWFASAETIENWSCLQEAVMKVLNEPEGINNFPMPSEEAPHPYGGQVALLRSPLWHLEASDS